MSKRSGRVWVVAVLALVLIGVLAGGGLYLLLRPGEPGAVQLTTTPPDADVVFDEEPVPALSSPFVITEVEPGIMHLIEVSKDGYRTWSMQLRVQPGQTLQLPPVTLEPLAASEPAIAEAPEIVEEEEAEPGAEEDTGEAGLSAEEAEAESAAEAAPVSRRRRRALARRRARRNRRSVGAVATSEGSAASEPAPEPEPEPGPPPEREHQPPPGMGLLHVQSRPWSQVHVNGRLVGSTPQRNIELPAGRHRLILINPDFNIRQTLTVNIRSGQVMNRSITLRQGE